MKNNKLKANLLQNWLTVKIYSRENWLCHSTADILLLHGTCLIGRFPMDIINLITPVTIAIQTARVAALSPKSIRTKCSFQTVPEAVAWFACGNSGIWKLHWWRYNTKSTETKLNRKRSLIGLIQFQSPGSLFIRYVMWSTKSVGSRKYWFWDIAKQRKYFL